MYIYICLEIWLWFPMQIGWFETLTNDATFTGKKRTVGTPMPANSMALPSSSLPENILPKSWNISRWICINPKPGVWPQSRLHFPLMKYDEISYAAASKRLKTFLIFHPTMVETQPVGVWLELPQPRRILKDVRSCCELINVSNHWNIDCPQII